MKSYKTRLALITNQAGSSLVFALIVSFMLIMLVTVTIHFSNTELKSATKQEKQTSAYYIAEAGIEMAIYDINQSLEKGEEPNSSLVEPNFEGGSYEVTITPQLNDYNENIGYLIESTGYFDGEDEKISQWVREGIWPPGPTPKPFEFAVFADDKVRVNTLSGLLGLGPIKTHEIKINGNIHGNNYVQLKHNGLFTSDPKVNGIASSTSISNIVISGLSSEKKTTYPKIPQPKFDFDRARKKAKQSGIYVPHSLLNISLLGLSPSDKIIFIDGDLFITGLDLLAISLQDRTIIVNGTITGALETGGNTFINAKLNLIAKENINFLGLVTGLQINGILFAQENISTEGHVEVDGYTGAKNIDCGSGLLGGLLESVLGLLTGSMKFTYEPNVFTSLPSNVGFKKLYVEVYKQG